ncbi:interleukin-1 family member A [Siniperca chuatsi]|uniref:interleukin-1 family member A n=1 Tax=Siniperca chuatsi TaxID=119488 RepID=UPI001CE128D7|nr:interleukin-1 family member A [Siniperca chuatsi]
MDLKDSLVKGGVLIVHHIHEGKHQYEVENVVKYKKPSGEKMFVRRGDKLIQINSMDLQDLTPEEVAQMLAEGNPLLTVHQAGRMKEHTKQPCPTEDFLYPVSKESTILSFCMEMRREEELEENEVVKGGEGREDGGIAEDVCKAENKENGEERDLLIISMMKTSISVVRGRGCDSGSPCQGCHGTGCTFHDVVMVSESRTVTLVPRGSGSFRQEKSKNVSIKHVASHQYLRGLCSQKTIYASPNPEKITIYSYKSNILERCFRGMPVVLNLAESNCFLRCCKEGERVLLQVETCEKQRLKQISKSDDSTLSFVFYMKGDQSKQLKFESALHLGWFIQIVNTDLVNMGSLDGGKEDYSFLFIIQK